MAKDRWQGKTRKWNCDKNEDEYHTAPQDALTLRRALAAPTEQTKVTPFMAISAQSATVARWSGSREGRVLLGNMTGEAFMRAWPNSCF